MPVLILLHSKLTQNRLKMYNNKMPEKEELANELEQAEMVKMKRAEKQALNVLEILKQEQEREKDSVKLVLRALDDFSTMPEGGKDGPKIETTGAEEYRVLENRLDRIRDLHGAAQKQQVELKKQSIEIISRIEEGPLLGSADFIKLAQDISSLRAIFQQRMQINRWLTGYANEADLIHRQYQASILREAQVANEEKLIEKMEDAGQDVRARKSHFFKVRFFKADKKALADAEIAHSKLKDLYYAYRTSYFSLEKGRDLNAQWLARDLSMAVFKRTRDSLNSRASALKDAIPKTESVEVLPSAVDQALRQGYARSIGFRRVKEYIDGQRRNVRYSRSKRKDVKELKEANDPKNLERTAELVEEGLEICNSVNYEFSAPDGYAEKRARFWEGVKKLPEILQEGIRKTLTGVKPKIEELREDVAFLRRAKVYGEVLDLRVRRSEALAAFEEYADKHSEESNPLKDAIIDARRGYSDPSSEILDGVDKKILSLSRELVKLCSLDPAIHDWIGSDTLAIAQELMHARTVVNVKSHPQHTNESNSWGWRLMEDHRAEDIPLLVMMAFRETGHSGDMPFINNDRVVDEEGEGMSYLGRTLLNLSAEDVEKVKACGVPGIAEIVSLARQYPRRFTKRFYSEKSETSRLQPGENLDNPIYDRVHEGLARASVYHLQSTDREMQFFTVGLLRCLGDEYASAELYSALIKAMRENSSIQEAGADVIGSWLGGDQDAPHIALQKLVTESDVRDPIFHATTEALKHSTDSFSAIVEMLKGAPENAERDRKSQAKRERYQKTLLVLIQKIKGALLTDSESAEEQWRRFHLDVRTTLNLVNAARSIGANSPELIRCAEELAKSEDQNTAFLGIQLARVGSADLNSWKDQIFNMLRAANRVRNDLNERDNLYVAGKELVAMLIGDAAQQFGANDRALLADAGLDPSVVESNDSIRYALQFALEHPGEPLRKFLDSSDSKRAEYIKSEIGALTEKNWAGLLVAYIELEGELLRLPPQVATALKGLFSTREHPESSEFVMAHLRQQWELFLSGACPTIPFESLMVADAVNKTGGAGPMKYVESLCDLMNKVRAQFARVSTAPTSKDAIRTGLSGFEQTFRDGKKKEKWSEDDKAGFYHLSAQVIEAAPSLYTDFLKVFEKLTPREDKEFSRDVFPLYQAWLVLLQKSDASGENTVSPGRELVKIRRNIDDLSSQLAAAPDEKVRASIFETAKLSVLEELKSNFQTRFGIIRVPEVFSEEDIRTLQDSILYLGNMSNKTTKHELVLGFYLALRLNGQWDAFRRGESVDAGVLIAPEKLSQVQIFLASRAEKNVLTSERLGISTEELPEFQRLLQDETLSMVVGSVATIDIRLGNAKRNLETLSDEDAYPEPIDKALLRLAKEHGKKLGLILKDLYLSASGKSDEELSGENQEVAATLAELLGVKELTAEQVQDIQKRLRPISSITNLVQSFEEADVDANIEELQKRLVPPATVVDIFNRLGESFSVTSGAMALSQDLGYLENIIVKHDKDLNDSEKQLLSGYLEHIRDQMKVLEAQLDKTKEGFTALKRSIHAKSSPILTDRLKEIESALYASEDSGELTTRVTNNLNSIIENIRQCLGCKRKEANNDTNVTFGDSNKFFVMSQMEGSDKSVADQIVLLAPLKFEKDGVVREELSFVFDTLYGSKSADVLVGHVAAVVKKYSQIARRFPGAKLSMFVTNAALSSAGVSEEILISKLSKEQNLAIKCQSSLSAKATVTESAAGDHYIEISGPARSTGPRTVSGTRITLAD